MVSLGLLAVAAGFGQFGAVAALGDIARGFGHRTGGTTVAEQAGLSGTTLGVGLTVVRLASLAVLLLAGLADRYGRRSVLLVSCAGGLTLTVLAAVSPGYWWFVAIIALARPLLSTTVSVARVGAAELTASCDRAKAVAMVAAGYGGGAGLTAIIHGVFADTLGFRGLFVLSVVPLVVLPPLASRVIEPDRFTRAAAVEHPLPVLGAVAPAFRRRLLVVVTLSFGLAVITGPANSFVFVYAQNVVDLSGVATAAMVVVAGVFGLVGLVAGRWLADRAGRRPTAAASMVAMALFGVLAYSGSQTALVVGYVLGVAAGSVFAPAAGALASEIFPTSVRASITGWEVAAGVLGAVVGLLSFGAVADLGDRFELAALVVILPAAGLAGLYWLLPETRGREPEDLWPGMA